MGLFTQGSRATMTLQRPPKSEAELAKCGALAGHALAAHVRQHGAGFCPETLVYLIRESHTNPDRELVEVCGRCLIGAQLSGQVFGAGHCEPLIRAVGRQFGFAADPDLLKEFRGRCHNMMWRAITAGRAAKPFWEERFFRALRGVCLDVGRSMRNDQTRFVPLMDDENPNAFEQGDAGMEADVLSGLDESTIRQLIRELPDRMRQAAWLCWVEGYQESSLDPSEVTVAMLMQLGDRMVRKYLKRARESLAKHPRIEAMRSDLGSR